MGISIYFGDREEALAGGFGFTEAGLWRQLPFREETTGLIIDDRFLPEGRGIEAARRALAGWTGLVICDFERPPSRLLTELAEALAGAQTVLPPAWAALPHGAVLVGPWMGETPFPRWLAEQRARYGAVVLDGLPLRAAAAPGGAWKPWTGPLPETGFPCPALGCLHRRLPDGRLLFWDTRETLAGRIRSADVPVIVFSEDWERLRER